MWLNYLGISQVELARKAGIRPSAVTSLIREGNRTRNQTYHKYAQVLGIPYNQFIAGPPSSRFTPPPLPVYDMSGQQVGELSRSPIPLLTDIPAGPWMDWLDTYAAGAGEDYIPRDNVRGAHVFAIRVRGDSMEPRLFEGDILVIDPEAPFEPKRGGRIAVVKFNGGYKIRTVHLNPDRATYLLEPLKKEFYETEIIPVTSADNLPGLGARQGLEDYLWFDAGKVGSCGGVSGRSRRIGC